MGSTVRIKALSGLVLKFYLDCEERKITRALCRVIVTLYIPWSPYWINMFAWCKKKENFWALFAFAGNKCEFLASILNLKNCALGLEV